MLSIIVPCYNEEETIPLFIAAVEKINLASYVSTEFVFIDDGSTDGTLATLRQIAAKRSDVRYISFSRNFGKEAAMYAGLQASRGDLVTVMDVDLQDPPEILPEMIRRIESEDLDCIATRRISRKGEPFLRSLFAKWFYWLINKISKTQIVDSVRDYRLMTRQMVDAILELSEYNRFSKGLFSWVGFKTEYVNFENRERVAGKTSWSLWKLFGYSLDGIINFSELPLTIASYAGIFFSFLAGAGMIFVVVRALFFGGSVNGWASTVTIMLLIGGIQLLALGVIGKYIGKIFMETKRRPLYITRETEKGREVRVKNTIKD